MWTIDEHDEEPQEQVMPVAHGELAAHQRHDPREHARQERVAHAGVEREAGDGLEQNARNVQEVDERRQRVVPGGDWFRASWSAARRLLMTSHDLLPLGPA